jgi:uncharacterized membrane protein
MNATKSITVARPRSEVYAFWRDFENLPRFMQHLESVENMGGGRSHWVAKGIAGNDREWDAELVEDHPNERISWRTVGADDDVTHGGTVSFLSVGDSATEVRVELEYDAPGGKLGATIARLFGEEPGQQIEEDLERFKQVLETGDFERPWQRASGIADVGIRRQEPVEPVNRETDPDARF